MLARAAKSLNKLRRAAALQPRPTGLESLESRTLMALIGVAPDVPLSIYNSTGTVNYNTVAGSFDLSATPLLFVLDGSSPVVTVGGTPTLEIHFQVNGAGALVGGIVGDDFIMTGEIDADDNGSVDYSGTLLTGEITGFGFAETGTTDQFDMRFTATGGSMVGIYAGKDIGVTVTSENSTFNDSFGENFNGGAKGNIGTVPTILRGRLSGAKFKDLTGNGLSNDDTPLGGTTINLFADANNDGVLTGADGAPIASDVSEPGTGAFSFEDLVPGRYFVEEVVPAGFVRTTPNFLDYYNVVVTDGSNTENLNFANAQLGRISGRKFNDITGNGQSNDDTPLGGTTINLFLDANNDGQLTGADGAPVATEITVAGTGAFAFESLTPGFYFVQEVVPAGYVRTGPMLTDTYNVTVGYGSDIGSRDFANFHKCDCEDDLVCVSFKLGGSRTVSDLRGNTRQNETVKVTFTVVGNNPVTVTLVSYKAPSPTWVVGEASQQTIFDLATGTFNPGGTYSMTVTTPPCYYQVDFVCGYAIDQLGLPGSNIFYSAQERLISADNGGLNSCVDDLVAGPDYFKSSTGQSLIRGLNATSSNTNPTNLASWLATSFPKMYGANSGSSNNLTGKRNSDVVALMLSYANNSSKTLNAEALATALSMYITKSSLGGATAGNFVQSYGFKVTSGGLGSSTRNVQSNGSAFGMTNNSTRTVLQLLQGMNNQSNNGSLYNGSSTLKTQAMNVFGNLNDLG